MTPKDVPQLRAEFDKRYDTWKRLQDEALFILEGALKKADVKYHSLTSRIKTCDSFLAKTEQKNLDDPFSQIRDVVGLRIVALFLSDVARIAELIRQSFEVVEEDNKIEGQEIGSFGYMSFHFTVKMRASYSGPRYDSLAHVPLEIQVRTIAMDAWAAASHYLDYKSDADIPSDLKRDFYALSGLFYVADKHFEMFFKSRQIVRKEIQQTLDKSQRDLDQEVNLDSLTAYLRSKFPDRKQPEPRGVSVLLKELPAGQYTTLSQLDSLINKHWDWFLNRERLKPPRDSADLRKFTKFAAIGVVRVILKDKGRVPAS